MGIQSNEFTPQEAVNVIDEALRLLATPETFVQGSWKCELYETDAKGRQKKDGLGYLIPKTDANGNRLYAYCVEGAINQACLNVLGKERAYVIGVDDIASAEPTNKLSVNEAARKLYGELLNTAGYSFAHPEDMYGLARAVNDRKLDGIKPEDQHAAAYERVMGMLRLRRRSLVRRLKSKTA